MGHTARGRYVGGPVGDDKLVRRSTYYVISCAGARLTVDECSTLWRGASRPPRWSLAQHGAHKLRRVRRTGRAGDGDAVGAAVVVARGRWVISVSDGPTPHLEAVFCASSALINLL